MPIDSLDKMFGTAEENNPKAWGKKKPKKLSKSKKCSKKKGR
jgi:hypothetical protein